LKKKIEFNGFAEIADILLIVPKHLMNAQSVSIHVIISKYSLRIINKEWRYL